MRMCAEKSRTTLTGPNPLVIAQISHFLCSLTHSLTGTDIVGTLEHAFKARVLVCPFHKRCAHTLCAFAARKEKKKLHRQ